ncbi:MAG: hypothetical protein J6A57_07090 [Ruminococcus sp.]|nr:hypothetical protein [Ruminococcus sp.]
MVKVVYDLSEDTKIREAARIREKALHDEASALANAKNEGRAEGRAEGRTLERADTIMRMKSLGFTDEQIKTVFGDFSL